MREVGKFTYYEDVNMELKFDFNELMDYFKKSTEIANVIVSTEAGTFSY